MARLSAQLIFSRARNCTWISVKWLRNKTMASGTRKKQEIIYPRKMGLCLVLLAASYALYPHDFCCCCCCCCCFLQLSAIFSVWFSLSGCFHGLLHVTMSSHKAPQLEIVSAFSNNIFLPSIRIRMTRMGFVVIWANGIISFFSFEFLRPTKKMKRTLRCCSEFYLQWCRPYAAELPPVCDWRLCHHHCWRRHQRRWWHCCSFVDICCSHFVHRF